MKKLTPGQALGITVKSRVRDRGRMQVLQLLKTLSHHNFGL